MDVAQFLSGERQRQDEANRAADPAAMLRWLQERVAELEGEVSRLKAAQVASTFYRRPPITVFPHPGAQHHFWSGGDLTWNGQQVTLLGRAVDDGDASGTCVVRA